jgi:hypothetical protein
MPDELSSPTEADFGRVLEEVGGLKQQTKNLEVDTASLNAENKGWIKKWGVYLGVLASPVAVPKAAKETLDNWSYLLWNNNNPQLRCGRGSLCLCATQGYSRDGGSPVWLP